MTMPAAAALVLLPILACCAKAPAAQNSPPIEAPLSIEAPREEAKKPKAKLDAKKAVDQAEAAARAARDAIDSYGAKK